MHRGRQQLTHSVTGLGTVGQHEGHAQVSGVYHWWLIELIGLGNSSQGKQHGGAEGLLVTLFNHPAQPGTHNEEPQEQVRTYTPESCYDKISQQKMHSFGQRRCTLTQSSMQINDETLSGPVMHFIVARRSGYCHTLKHTLHEIFPHSHTQ
jgi:hypothetical protein